MRLCPCARRGSPLPSPPACGQALATATDPPPLAVGATIFLHDPGFPIPRYQLPQFAALRNLLTELCTSEESYAWAGVNGVVIQPPGHGAQSQGIELKKPMGCGTVDTVDFRFRFTNEKSSRGFGLKALIAKLGSVPASEAGVDRLVVVSVVENVVWAVHTDDGHQVCVQLDVADRDSGAQCSWDLAPCASMSVTATHSDADAEDDTSEADADTVALAPLYSVATKIVATLYALAGGRAEVGISREDLLRPLAAMNVGNPGNALRFARVATYDPVWFRHNGERGQNARLALTPRGVTMVMNMHTRAEGGVDQASLDAMVAAIGRLCAPATPPPPPKKRRAETANQEAEEAPVEDEDEGEEEGEEEASGLELRLEALLDRFDGAIDPDAVAQAYGQAAAAHLRVHKAVPSNEQSEAMLREARATLIASVSIGRGGVKREQVSALLLKVRAASKLPEQVAALELEMRAV